MVGRKLLEKKIINILPISVYFTPILELKILMFKMTSLHKISLSYHLLYKVIMCYMNKSKQKLPFVFITQDIYLMNTNHLKMKSSI